jgi:hypothetical protein
MTKREVEAKYCFGIANPDEYIKIAEYRASLEKQVAEMQAEIKKLKDSVTTSYEAKCRGKIGMLIVSPFNLQFWLYDEQKDKIKHTISLNEDDSIQIIKPW